LTNCIDFAQTLTDIECHHFCFFTVFKEAFMQRVAAYFRTSSTANKDGDSLPRQRDAVQEYAARNQMTIEVTRHDVKTGNSAIEERVGFADLIAECQERGLGIILVENASRFSRDLVHQEMGVEQLQKLGLHLIPVDAPEYFTEDTPSRVLIRQVLGAVSQFEKGNVVAKLKRGRNKKREETGKKVGGRQSFAEIDSELVINAKRISRQVSKTRSGKTKSLREIAQTLFDQGHTDKVLSAQSIKNMLAQKVPA
jgi:DNA invertase Pin-like site-specific DNA recombinase